MTRIRVLPYKQGSRSAKALSEALGGLVLRREGSRFRPRSTDTIINWGSSITGGVPVTFNQPERVALSSNKLSWFTAIQPLAPEVVPQFWTRREDIPSSAYPIVCRTILDGHSGAGIVIAATPDDLVPAPLYVKYENKKQEYRVHVGATPGRTNPERIIAVQRKARNMSVPDDQVNWQVRNHSNGFIYVRQNVVAPTEVLDAARQVFAQTGLDFGAVDVVHNERQSRAYVLEVNTAPGLEGQSVHDYAQFFTDIRGVE